jgi:hypothetical protein
MSNLAGLPVGKALAAGYSLFKPTHEPASIIHDRNGGWVVSDLELRMPVSLA